MPFPHIPAGTVLAENVQTGNYTFVAADAGRVVVYNSVSAGTFTIPPASSVPWVAGSMIWVFNANTGLVTIAAGAGVTLQALFSRFSAGYQYSDLFLRYRGSNVWALGGNVG